MFIRTAYVLIICWLAAACVSMAPQSNNADTSPIIIGQTYHLSSEATGLTHEVNIWTPPEMGKAGKTHPVLYLLDGGVEQDFFHIAGLAQLSTINGTFETPIVVGIRTDNRYYQLTPKMTDSRYLPWNGSVEKPEMGGADDFVDFISKTVMPFTEQNFPTSDRKMLMGESLAGFFVTRMFLRYPEAFTDYIAISPSLWLDDQRLAKEAENLLYNHRDEVRNLYLTMADEGGTMQAGLDKVLKALKRRNFKHLNLIYVDRRNSERHATIYHGAALNALMQLHGHPVPDYGPAPWYLREGGVPEENQQ